MDYFEKIVISLIVLLSGAFFILYFGKSRLSKYLKINDQSIVLVEQKFIPKTGHASLLQIGSSKYLVVSNANAIAITAINEDSAAPNTIIENQ